MSISFELFFRDLKICWFVITIRFLEKQRMLEPESNVEILLCGMFIYWRMLERDSNVVILLYGMFIYW